MALLEVKNIKKSFGKTEVLKGIYFSIEKGKVLSIIGSSGSGKTTLLRCINFLEFAEEGTISVNGETIYNGETDKRIKDKELRDKRLHFGLVFQSFNLFPQYNVLQNVMLAPSLKRLVLLKNTRIIRVSFQADSSSVLRLQGRLCLIPIFSALMNQPLLLILSLRVRCLRLSNL